MKHRFPSLFLLLAAAALLISRSNAGEIRPYDAEAFEQAKAEDKTTVLDFSASWCPVCKVQGKTLASLLQSEEDFADVVAFKIDYDSNPELKKRHGVTSQSTLVVFKGAQEVDRAVAITDADAIKGLVSAGI